MCGHSSPCASISASSLNNSIVRPSAMISPRSSTIARGHSSTASSKSCVAISFVAGISRSNALNSRRPRGSRSLVGSSKIENRRFARQHARQADAPFFAVAQMMRRAVAKTGQPRLRERFLHARRHFRFRQTQLLRAERHVLRHRRAKQLVVRVLKNQADLAADGFQIFRRDRFAQNFHRAVAGQFFRHKCRSSAAASVDLPEPFGPSSATHSPGAMREAHPAQRLRAVVVTVFQIGDFNRVHFISSLARTWRRKCVRPVPRRG